MNPSDFYVDPKTDTSSGTICTNMKKAITFFKIIAFF